jgi:hypothetical protein
MCLYIVKKRLGKKDKKWWHCDKILVHLKEFAPKMPLLCASVLSIMKKMKFQNVKNNFSII